MTREEAQKEVERINSNNPEWFCPLAQGQCQKNCICLEKAQTTTIGHHLNPKEDYSTKDNYNVIGPKCTNDMFFKKTTNVN